MLHKFTVAMVVLLLVPGSILAQSTNATITGRITDPSKAYIVGARVVATNVDTGVQQSTTTGSEGLYTIVSLKPGNYKLEVEKQGFRTVVKPDLVVHVQDVSTINFEMAIGASSERKFRDYKCARFKPDWRWRHTWIQRFRRYEQPCIRRCAARIQNPNVEFCA